MKKIRLLGRKPHIVVHLRNRDPWVTLVGANGEPLMHSQGYRSGNAGAKHAAAVLSEHSGFKVREVRERDLPVLHPNDGRHGAPETP